MRAGSPGSMVGGGELADTVDALQRYGGDRGPSPRPGVGADQCGRAAQRAPEVAVDGQHDGPVTVTGRRSIGPCLTEVRGGASGSVGRGLRRASVAEGHATDASTHGTAAVTPRPAVSGPLVPRHSDGTAIAATSTTAADPAAEIRRRRRRRRTPGHSRATGSGQPGSAYRSSVRESLSRCSMLTGEVTFLPDGAPPRPHEVWPRRARRCS